MISEPENSSRDSQKHDVPIRVMTCRAVSDSVTRAVEVYAEADERTKDFRQSLDALRSAQKPSFGTPAYSRYVNRPAGRLVAALTHGIGLTPNGATVFSAILSAAGLVLLSVCPPSWWMSVGVALLLASGYVLDSVDGQLARLRGGGSLRGEWLDHTVDCFKTTSLHLAVAISWYRFPPVPEREWLLVPLAFAVVQSAMYFGLILMPTLRAKRVGSAGSPGPENPLRKWLILPTDYGFLCWVFVLVALPSTFMAAYAVLFAMSSAMLVVALRKWWRELGAIDRAVLKAKLEPLPVASTDRRPT